MPNQVQREFLGETQAGRTLKQKIASRRQQRNKIAPGAARINGIRTAYAGVPMNSSQINEFRRDCIRQRLTEHQITQMEHLLTLNPGVELTITSYKHTTIIEYPGMYGYLILMRDHEIHNYILRIFN